MTLGFHRDLYVLPFDHRGSFETKMFGWEEPGNSWTSSREPAPERRDVRP
jgi:hypothetical protein